MAETMKSSVAFGSLLGSKESKWKGESITPVDCNKSVSSKAFPSQLTLVF